MSELNPLRCLLIGAQSRLIRCGDILLDKCHKIVGVISPDPEIRRWAAAKNLQMFNPGEDLLQRLSLEPIDLLFSIDNFWRVPNELLDMARKYAVNFHDAPLPRYAGVNATNWAILNQEKVHGVTWHVMCERVDAGDILKQALIPVAPKETALTLNGKCYEKSIQIFEELVDEICTNRVTPIKQNLENRTYFGRWRRPPAACTLDWNCTAEEIDSLVRGLNFGTYWNPLGLPKLRVGNRVVIVRRAEITDRDSSAPPGTITFLDSEIIDVATGTWDIALGEFASFAGDLLDPETFLKDAGLHVGDRLPCLAPEQVEAITKIHSDLCRYEQFWIKHLRETEAIEIPYAVAGKETKHVRDYVPVQIPLPETFPLSIGTSAGDSILACIVLYLCRMSQESDFTVDVQDASLRSRISGGEPYFAEHLPMHVHADLTEGFGEFCQRIQEGAAAIHAHGSYVRDLLLREPSLRKALNFSVGRSTPVVLVRTENEGESKPEVDADLVVVIPDDGAQCVWWYDRSVFEEAAIERMQEQFKFLLAAIVVNRNLPVAELPIVSESDRRKTVVEWNSTQVDYPQDVLLYELFESQVEKTPNAVAVQFETETLSYRQLNGRANQLAHYLGRLGVRPDTFVGICMERSLDLAVALYAVLKAGGAYVPVDPEYPQERIEFMLRDATPSVLLTQRQLTDRLPYTDSRVFCLEEEWEKAGGEDATNPRRTITPDSLAYMIYTSGSTGKPKGAMNTHRGICNRLLWMQEQYGLRDTDSVLQKTPFSFDVSVWEFFWPLLVGARLVVAKPGGHRDPAYLANLIAQEGISVLHFVPSMLRMFLEEPGVKRCKSLRHVICSGEALSYDLQERFFELFSAQLHNLYGPTEAAVDVTHWTCQPHSERKFVPIGRPVANTRVYILDRNLQPLPVGVPGELYIGGVQVGRGYHNRPELTTERFIPDPFSLRVGARIYKSGDLCRWLPDGNIEYLGRTDFQVKLRGLRIELGEIEAEINAHPLVKTSLVTTQEGKGGEKLLVAYVLSESEAGSLTEELRDHLKKKLPEYMVPSAFVRLGQFPMMPNGKVDRKALPPPAETPQADDERFVAPENDVEHRVAEIWQEVLGVSKVGRHSNFFDLGGDSLRLMIVRRRLQKALNKDVAIVDLFRWTTVCALAKHLTGQGEDAGAQRSDLEGIANRRNARRRLLSRRRSIDSKGGVADESAGRN